LRTNGNTAVDRSRVQLRSDPFELSTYLHGQFTRRYDDDTVRRLARALRIDGLDDRQREGQRLAGASARSTDDIAATANVSIGARLNREGIGETLGREEGRTLGRESELLERDAGVELLGILDLLDVALEIAPRSRRIGRRRITTLVLLLMELLRAATESLEKARVLTSIQP